MIAVPRLCSRSELLRRSKAVAAGRASRRLAVWVLAISTVMLLVVLDSDGQEPPSPSGYIEEVETRLILLDVLVEDEAGEPVPGLGKDDFEIRVEGRSWPVYSVDDLCECPESSGAMADTEIPASEGIARGPVAGGATRTEPKISPDSPNDEAGVAAGGANASQAASTEALVRASILPESLPGTRFILYFDYHQIQLDGRKRAVGQAERWVQEQMRDGDEAMVVAYGTRFKELSPFTSNRELLLDAIKRGYDDPELRDAFPSLYRVRRRECEAAAASDASEQLVRLDSVWECDTFASEEWVHGRQSIRTLELFLNELQHTDGRKSLLMFHQNSTMFPAALYPNSNEFRIGDNTALLEDLGAAATQARTAVFAAFVGGLGTEPEDVVIRESGVNFGANLADATGGDYNRTPGTLSDLLGGAGRDCCYYRIAFEPPPSKRLRTNQLRVRVNGRQLKNLYRVKRQTERDRWISQAQFAMLQPDRATDVGVAVSVVPLAIRGERWEAAVEVAVDLGTLVMLPTGERRVGEWGAGALLIGLSHGKTWEMERFSGVRTDDTSGRYAVHSKILSLRPGDYELVAYAGDVKARLFGGDQLRFSLPPPGEDTVSDPTLRRSRVKKIELPFGERSSRRNGQFKSLKVDEGSMPLGSAPVRSGETLEATTWICPAAKRRLRASSLRRFITRDGEPVFRVNGSEPQRDRSCFRVIDEIDLSQEQIRPGRYGYHLQWFGAADGELREGRVEFTVH